MPSLRFRLATVGLVAAMAIAARPASAQGPLTWTFKQGDTYKYAFMQTNESKVTINGQQNTSKIELNVDLAWSVNSVAADGSAELAQTVGRMRATFTLGGMVMKYDSKEKQATDPGAQEVAKVYDAIIGKPFTIKIGATGQVSDVKVPEAVTAAAAGTNFARLADMGSFLSAKGVENLLNQVMPRVDPKAVAKGATWESELTIPVPPQSMKIKSSYTLADPGPPATLNAEITTTITTAPGAVVNLTVNKQSGKATYHFDKAAGRLVDSTVNQSFDMTMTGPNGDVGQVIAILSTLKAAP